MKQLIYHYCSYWLLHFTRISGAISLDNGKFLSLCILILWHLKLLLRFIMSFSFYDQSLKPLSASILCIFPIMMLWARVQPIWNFGGRCQYQLLGVKKFRYLINIGWYCTYVISTECGYQVLVTKTCYGGRISYVLTNIILNFSALRSKHFTYESWNKDLQNM